MNTSGFVENQSISEERQAIEEAIEENEKELIPHESFYSDIFGDTFLPEKFASNSNTKFTLSSPTSRTKMSVTPSKLTKYLVF